MVLLMNRLVVGYSQYSAIKTLGTVFGLHIMHLKIKTVVDTGDKVRDENSEKVLLKIELRRLDLNSIY